MKNMSPLRHLSVLSAWALAFGCAVGSDSFVMPWTTCLPKAGPLGTILGILAGGLIMVIIAWNYHFMMNRYPGPGGAYDYAMEAFGGDHGFLCGWFLGFTYVGIVWLDATALVIIARYELGDFFRFGFKYMVGGFDVCFGDIVLPAIGIVIAALICCRRRLSGLMQTVLVVAFAAGILVCFLAAAFSHTGGVQTMGAAFMPGIGSPFSQIMHIVIISTWLFVGFESISNSSSEFRFPLKKAFAVMVAAIGTSVLAYVLLTLIPVLVPGEAYADWTKSILHVGDPDFHAFDVASRSLGKIGCAVMGVTLICAVFTNLVGNTVAASRLLAAMSDDGILPSWFGGKNADGAPRNAVLLIMGLTILATAFGRAVIGIVVDIAIVGAAVAYAYTSAATLKIAHATRDRRAQTTGLAGLLISIAIIFIFILPFILLKNALMATESYFILVLWCIAGLVVFFYAFHREHQRRLGRSTVAWISLFAIMLVMSLIWVRQTTYEISAKAFDAIVRVHTEDCRAEGIPTAHEHGGGKWLEEIRDEQNIVSRSFMRNSYIQTGITIFALVLMICLFLVQRRREHEMEVEKAKAKSFFFSTVSHDIRTPLNAIIGFSEMLKVGFKTEEERAQAVDSILMSGKTLLGLINDVLDLSKLESGKMEISPEPTDCQSLFNAVVDAFRVSSNRPEVELRCHVAPMPPLMIDPQRIRQIVFNLVGNAMKFTERGHVELRASFSPSENSESGVFQFEIEDTGCGISKENLKHLGSAYVQVGEKKTRAGGTGLGLAICHQLATAMKGRLSVASTLGQGSTFTFTIPDVKTAPDAGLAKNGAADLQATPCAAASSVHRILIVDDSRMNRMVLKALLGNAGDFDTVLATDGQDALKVLQAPDAGTFDLVLTDLWMPNMDGEGLIKAIRANPKLSSLRVVAVTADVEFQAKSAALGFNGVLLKPVTIVKLGQLLGNIG